MRNEELNLYDLLQYLLHCPEQEERKSVLLDIGFDAKVIEEAVDDDFVSEVQVPVPFDRLTPTGRLEIVMENR